MEDDRVRFVAALRLRAPDVPDEVGALWTDARAAWPALPVDPDGFGTYVAGVFGDDELRAADLYVAWAALAGDRAALGELERLLAPVRATALRAGYDGALVDDALQTVRYRLLVAVPEREAKLRTYRGRGSLAGWLRVVALRQLRALAGPRVERSDSALSLAATEADAALAVLVRTHGPAVRRMFREALAALDDQQRMLLKLEIVEEVPHGTIATRLGVHRTTVVRWIEDARQRLAREVRRRLRRELSLGDDSADSLLQALAGQVELSIGSGLL